MRWTHLSHHRLLPPIFQESVISIFCGREGERNLERRHVVKIRYETKQERSRSRGYGVAPVPHLQPPRPAPRNPRRRRYGMMVPYLLRRIATRDLMVARSMFLALVLTSFSYLVKSSKSDFNAFTMTFYIAYLFS